MTSESVPVTTPPRRVDRQMAERLWAEHARMVRRYLRVLGAAGQDLDDLLQETFVVLLQRDFEDRGGAAVATFLRTTARFLFLRRHRNLLPQVEAADVVWDRRCGDDDGAGYLAALRACVERLPARSRRLVQLGYDDETRSRGDRARTRHEGGWREDGAAARARCAAAMHRTEDGTMNRNELETAAEERLFAASLDEVLGDSAVSSRRTAAPRTRWMAAAIVLLGLAVVAGVVVTSRMGFAVAVTPQDPASLPLPLPPIVKVKGLAELQKVDRSTENLWCEFERPEEIALLKDLSRLRGLRITQVQMAGDVMADPAWSLEPVADCMKLEWVSVRYFGRGRQVGGPVLPFAAVDLAPLARLPHLRSLELVGGEKLLDADLAAALHKLSLRCLVLQAVHCTPEGLRSLGELPLLERLELRDCSGLEQCDLRHLFRLRQLRALTMCGIGGARAAMLDRTRVGGWGAVAKAGPGEPTQLVTAAWMRGLAIALPDLRELDLAESWLGAQVLAALPRGLTFLGLHGAMSRGEPDLGAVGELPDLRGLAFGDPLSPYFKDDRVPLLGWLALLAKKKLQRIEFTGVPTEELLDALRGQLELRELRLTLLSKYSFYIVGERRVPAPVDEVALPSFTRLAGLPHLERIELVGPSKAQEKAIRQAVGDRVRVDVLPR